MFSCEVASGPVCWVHTWGGGSVADCTGVPWKCTLGAGRESQASAHRTVPPSGVWAPEPGLWRCGTLQGRVGPGEGVCLPLLLMVLDLGDDPHNPQPLILPMSQQFLDPWGRKRMRCKTRWVGAPLSALSLAQRTVPLGFPCFWGPLRTLALG